MISLLCATVAMSLPLPSKTYAAWGADVFEHIKKDFYLPDRKLYAESSGSVKPAFDWSVGVLLSALNAAAAYDEKYKAPLKEFADAIDVYWNPAPPVAGYDVLPWPKDADRYYDDNEWMVTALCDTAGILKDQKYLDKAKAALAFVLSGKDDKLGGGIYWRESDKKTKNTCSNAPAVYALLTYSRIANDDTYQKAAMPLYDWTHINLRDPDTALYWDSIDLNGHIGKDFWTYNTAMMIKDASMLYYITQDEKYAEQARQAEAASVLRWVGPDGELKDEGKFAHMLVEAWFLRLRQAPRHNEVFGAAGHGFDAIKFLHDRVRDPNGHYPSRWDIPAAGKLKKWNLIDQASAMRAYFDAALFTTRPS